MFRIWLPQRQRSRSGPAAERSLPVLVVALHGIAAVTIIVLTFVAALTL
jgi:hypothetical protein